MATDYMHLVAVAAGSQKQVQEWSRILKSVRVEFNVVEPWQAESDYLEVWVALDDCEAARSALQKRDGKTRMW